MYSVKVYFSQNSEKNYTSIKEITQDFKFLEKPTKEGFYKDILSDDLIEIENVDGKYVVTTHMFINKINFKNLENIYQNFQLKEKPLKEGFYRDIESNLIEITKEDI
jgi:hypothetical protein